MLGFVIVICTFLALFAASSCSLYRGRPSTPEATGAAEPDGTGSEEGALVVRLLRHEITERQYQEAMSGLAERDAIRHPLAVPPDP